jgi:hypothetical protein
VSILFLRSKMDSQKSIRFEMRMLAHHQEVMSFCTEGTGRPKKGVLTVERSRRVSFCKDREQGDPE